MSKSHSNYYQPRLKRSPSGFFVAKEGLVVNQNSFDHGVGGAIFDTKQVISSLSSNIPDLVVKKMSFASSELENAKREVSIFKKRYGYGELYYDSNKEIARAILLKLPGKSLANYYFTDLLDFLYIWIQTQLEIHFLHTLGIVHGDVNSYNTLYDGNKIFLCDFGLSRHIGEITSGLRTEESPHLHPTLGKKPIPQADPSFDVYSLGYRVIDFDLAHTEYNPTIKKPLATTLLKEIVIGMTDLNPKTQWSLSKAIEESVKLYNSLQPDPSKKMSFSPQDYKPSSIEFLPSALKNQEIVGFKIPSSALAPIDIDHISLQENKKIPSKNAAKKHPSPLVSNNVFVTGNKILTPPSEVPDAFPSHSLKNQHPTSRR